MQQDCQQLWY